MIQIYSYIPDSNRKSQLTQICANLGLTQAFLSPKDLSRTIREIIGAPNLNQNTRTSKVKSPATKGCDTTGLATGDMHTSVPVFYAMPEFLLFSGLSSDRLDDFLAEVKRVGMAPVALKAIVTPYNMNWSLYQLIEQIKAEATY